MSATRVCESKDSILKGVGAIQLVQPNAIRRRSPTSWYLSAPRDRKSVVPIVLLDNNVDITTMKYPVVLSALLASASAFVPQQQSGVSTRLNAEMSKSLPFLTEPKNLKGWVGDVGFDPLGFSDYFDMKWLREAEIKHGRSSMLATVGFVMQEYLTIPGYEHVDDSNLAPSVVGVSAMLQIVFWMGVLEFWTNKGNVTIETMFSDPDRVPGDLGFDPMGLAVGKTDEEMDKMKLREIKNGRLAMLAIGGMIHHNWVTGEPLF